MANQFTCSAGNGYYCKEEKEPIMLYCCASNFEMKLGKEKHQFLCKRPRRRDHIAQTKSSSSISECNAPTIFTENVMKDLQRQQQQKHNSMVQGQEQEQKHHQQQRRQREQQQQEEQEQEQEKKIQQRYWAVKLQNRGQKAAEEGNYRDAHEYYEKSLALLYSFFGRDANNDFLAKTLHMLGILDHKLFHYQDARSYCEKALAMYYRLYGREGNNRNLARVLTLLSKLEKKLGNRDIARSYQAKAAGILLGQQQGQPTTMITTTTTQTSRLKN